MARLIHVQPLPAGALDAAAAFHAHWADKVRKALGEGENVVVLVPPASYDHRDCRLAAARDLARSYAPHRCNMVEGLDGPPLDATLAYLDRAPGVTGQYLPLSRAAD